MSFSTEPEPTPFWELVLVAALLVPTDAAMGQNLFNHPAVPEDTRHALSAESGLNDGAALPMILFAACAVAGFDHPAVQESWLLFAAEQIGYGVAVGTALGWLAGLLERVGRERGLLQDGDGALVAILSVVLIFGAATLTGGNGFVAAFCGGFAFGHAGGASTDAPARFLGTTARLLMLGAFAVIGAVSLPAGLPHVTPGVVALVLGSMIVARPLAIWLSLAGASVAPRERLLIGWFGPAGLATALFAAIVLEDIGQLMAADTIHAVVACAVIASALLHGATAWRPTILLGKH